MRFFFLLFWFICFLLLIGFTISVHTALSLFLFFFFHIHDDLILRLNVLHASEFVYHWKAQADVVNLLKDLKRHCTLLVVSHDLRVCRLRAVQTSLSKHLN